MGAAGRRGEEEARAGEEAQAMVLLWSEERSFSLGKWTEGLA